MSGSSPAERAWLRAGVVGRAHGLDGSFYVSEPAEGLLGPDREVRVREHLLRVERYSGTTARPIIRVSGVEDRTGAEALRGTEIWVDRGVAPELEQDEWWAEDLEGCSVVDGDRAVGRVRRLSALPSCEVLEVEREGEALLLVPLVGDAVRSVDVQAKVIDVDLRFLGEE